MEKTTVGLLIAINLMYVCIGAAVFMVLESDNETTTSKEILNTVNTFLGKNPLLSTDRFYGRYRFLNHR